MALVKAEIRGLAKLNAKLTKMTKESGTGLERGINMATAVVSGRAKALAPVDTGHLRASIHAKQAEVHGDEITGAVIASAEHAVYVEFGTGIRGNGSYPEEYAKKGQNLAYGPNHAGQVAQPFLGRALHESERDIDRIVLTGFRKSLGGSK